MARNLELRSARQVPHSPFATNWKAVGLVAALTLFLASSVSLWVFSSRPESTTGAQAGTDDAPDRRAWRNFDERGELARPRFVYKPWLRDTGPPVTTLPPDLPPRRTPGATEVAKASHVDASADDKSGFEEVASADSKAIDPKYSPLSLDETGLRLQLAFDSQSQRLLLGGHSHDPRTQRIPTYRVDLDSVKGTTARLRALIVKRDDADVDSWLAFVDKRPDLQGLPYRKGKSCQLDKQAAAALGSISREGARRILRFALYESSFSEYPSGSAEQPEARYMKRILRGKTSSYDEMVPGAVQILQAQGSIARRHLIQFIANVDGPNATSALVQRALFDLSSTIRKLAVEELRSREPQAFLKGLLAGFRYPWPAVADHAALALAAIKDQDAVEGLVNLLDQPDPVAPFVNEKNKWAVRELVRINHQRNCMLCHAPSLNTSDPIRGAVPIPGQSLPRQYYQSRSRGFVFVRADVTYLKQDFSVMHAVKDHGLWPKIQRFDYLVRTRALTQKEVAERKLSQATLIQKTPDLEAKSYPQREAVLYALRKLTGRDAGESSQGWRKMLKRGAVASDAARPKTTVPD